ncbi:N-6 DNA methylase [Pseudoflavonifractor capillosus]|uniref:N-6 DNA methylase n=1 Tax=Pseudoflavonifractor capillosus TaxID=106588 RepID=UPI001957D594|nr:N-6 DNA methylase [Pseudoflavonifractor capillosus]MBM6679920.1 N-6 DNA methylase [Pseudoflavonifractor capillosus]
MRDKYFYEVMFDDTSIDVSKEVGLVWSIANSLRGAYTSDKYKDVIIPMVIIRRFECALEATKDAVVAKHKQNPNLPAALLCQVSKYPFYNTSEFTLKRLLDDSDSIASNLKSYIEGFSANIQLILEKLLKFSTQIDKMDKSNRLYSVVKKFSDLDLYPAHVDSMKMGYIFEDIIRRFSENAEAGDHYTPREVIRLMVNVLLAEGCNDLLTDEGKIATVLDAACGSGGMLSTTYDFLRRKNPYVDVRLFGQEINPESYAICLADMLIKGQDVKNIMGDEEANTLKTDCFPDQKMRLVIMNPPFGTPWGGKDAPEGQEKKVREENKKGGRFEHGLPGTGDAQLLFMQHAINKLDEKNGRAAIITNGSPLFSGGTTSGESQIRHWMLEEDLIEAIIALPTQLFYNTDIGIYIFILSRNKRPDRRGKVQLINAVDMWKPLRKSLGKKRREIDRDSMVKITELYSNFEENQYCKIFPNEEFMYKEYAVYQPLQRRGVLDEESIERLRTSSYFTSNSSIFNETDFEQLKEMNPRSAADEKKYQKYLAGQQFVADVLTILEANRSDQMFMDYGEFEKYLKSLLGKVEGMSASRLTGIAMVLAVMDKTAVVQKDRKGEIVKDTTTKDTEIIKLTQDPEKYFEAEVYPHVPDAIWLYEFDPSKKVSVSNRERIGAEIAFTQYFYEYSRNDTAQGIHNKIAQNTVALQHIFSVNDVEQRNLDALISTYEDQLQLGKKYRDLFVLETLLRGLDPTVELKDSGLIWFGKIPAHWEVKRIKYVIKQGNDGIKVGPFGSALTNEVVSADDGQFKVYGQANLIRRDFEYGDNFVTEDNYLRLKNYEVLPYDIVVSMMGTIGKCCVVPEGISPGIMDSHLIKVRLSSLMFPQYFEYLYESEAVYEQLLLKSKGSIMNGLNSTIVKNVYMVVPPVEEQIAICRYINEHLSDAVEVK